MRGKKLNISVVFTSDQSYFTVLIARILNKTHYFIIKIPNKRELQQISLNPSSDIEIS